MDYNYSNSLSQKHFMAYLIIFLSLFVASIVCSNSQYRPYDIEFMGTREKRNVNEENDSDFTISPFNQELLFLTNLESNKGENNRNTLEYLSNLPELSVFKRAPTGFMGMRGKKDFQYLKTNDRLFGNLISERTQLPLNAFKRILINPNRKRIPSGFMGMRGKKLENFFDNKRVPVGFLGTRGKKDLYDVEENNGTNSEFNLYNSHKTVSNSFIGEESNIPIEHPSDSEFFGIRDSKYYDAENIQKRALTGFFGVRGKKFDSSEESFLNMKKQKLNEFSGVRSKKDILSQSEEDKRSSFLQLFGIRGKKQPFNSGFFGMRGKKEPFHFRGKFVGVRGKKSSEKNVNSDDCPQTGCSGYSLNSYDDILKHPTKDTEGKNLFNSGDAEK